MGEVFEGNGEIMLSTEDFDLEKLLTELTTYEERTSVIYCSDCGKAIETWDIPYFVTGPARPVCWDCAIRSIGYER